MKVDFPEPEIPKKRNERVSLRNRFSFSISLLIRRLICPDFENPPAHCMTWEESVVYGFSIGDKTNIKRFTSEDIEFYKLV
jgi:hypothetical protein